MRRFGLADGLGLVGVLVAVAWLPGAADPLTYIKLMMLGAGGLALAPAVMMRWKSLKRPPALVFVPSAAAVLIVAWGLVSSMGSGAPVWNTVFGWWGRGDGLLAWLGATTLLLGAATLSASEVRRTVTWLLGGATFVAFIGALQAVGIDIPEGAGGQVSGTMGNTNFAAGYFAILGVLALGMALSSGTPARRAWGGLLFVALAVLSWLTNSVQGPAALAAGVVALGAAYALMYRGPFRIAALVASGAVVAVGVGLLFLSAFGQGPLARLWSERTFDIRQEYWISAIRTMNGLPVFGTGPDGFSRYVAEFRPESYVELLGPTLRVSAAHNIALQFGAVLGWIGLILWILLFGGTVLALWLRIVRGPAASLALTAAVAGALTAYLVQGMVSIDMLPLLATGWLVAGLALSLAREPLQIAEPQAPISVSTSRSAKAASARRTTKSTETSSSLWIHITGGVLAVSAALLVGGQIVLTNQVQSIASQEQALNFITNPMTPCVLRVQVTQQVIQQLPADVSVPATIKATDLDRRCPPMINFASDVLVQQQRFDVAAPYTADGVDFDPLLDLAWVIRSRYYLGVGDIPAAEAAADEARRVSSLYAGDPALLEALMSDITSAKEQVG